MDLSRRSLLSAFSLMPAARLLLGQAPAGQTAPQPAAPQQAAPQQAPTFSTDVKVVNIFATVRDKKGAIVRNLTQNDFVVEEDGRGQVIRYFSQESNLPLTLGLLVDTSGSVRSVLNDERSASYKFFDQILREDRDLAFLIHFDHEVELLQDLTPSRAKLEKGLDELAVDQNNQQQQQQGQGGGQYPQGGGYPGGYPGGGYPGGGQRYPRQARGGTKLYDAILLASDDLMSKQKGRKALILLTDGVDSGSKTTLASAISSAQHADTLVYSIHFTGSEGNNYGPLSGPGMGRRRMGYPGGGYPGGGYPGGGGGYNHADGKKVLQQISQETGGRYFDVSHHLPIDKVYAEIEEDLRNQYNIGYTSDAPKDAGAAYRHIHVTAKPKNLTVSAREGYYPG